MSARTVEGVAVKKQLGRLIFLLSERADLAAHCQSFDSMAAAAALVEWKHAELPLKWEAVPVRRPFFLIGQLWKGTVLTC